MDNVESELDHTTGQKIERDQASITMFCRTTLDIFISTYLFLYSSVKCAQMKNNRKYQRKNYSNNNYKTHKQHGYAELETDKFAIWFAFVLACVHATPVYIFSCELIKFSFSNRNKIILTRATHRSSRKKNWARIHVVAALAIVAPYRGEMSISEHSQSTNRLVEKCMAHRTKRQQTNELN